jgi:hypothetical protein
MVAAEGLDSVMRSNVWDGMVRLWLWLWASNNKDIIGGTAE